MYIILKCNFNQQMVTPSVCLAKEATPMPNIYKLVGEPGMKAITFSSVARNLRLEAIYYMRNKYKDYKLAWQSVYKITSSCNELNKCHLIHRQNLYVR